MMLLLGFAPLFSGSKDPFSETEITAPKVALQPLSQDRSLPHRSTAPP